MTARVQGYIATLAFLAVSATLAGCSRPPHPLEGQEAPEIALGLLGGGSFRLSEHRGEHIVLLDFWATWCGPCRTYMPVIEEVAAEFEDDDVILIAVNSGEDPPTVQRYVDAYPVRSAIALDMTGAASIAYQADFIPQTVLIDKDGIVRRVYTGGSPGTASRIRTDLRNLTSR